MNFKNGPFSQNKRIFSRSLVVLFAVFMISLLAFATADDAAAEGGTGEFMITFDDEEITVKDGDTVVNSSDNIAQGTELTVKAIEKTGHTSTLIATVGTIGEGGAYIVTGEVTFSNTYIPIEHTITWIVNEETVKTEDLAYDSPLTPESSFETARYTYTDVTWEGSNPLSPVM